MEPLKDPKDLDTDTRWQSHFIFSCLCTCFSNEELKQIQEEKFIIDYKISSEQYPRLDLTITKEQVDLLIENNTIRQDGSLDETKLKDQSALAQLLYSFLWKQGDHKKIKHVVNGYLNKKLDDKDAVVLYYFGRHLADNSQPIIDQHVIRAFAVANKRDFNPDLLRKSDKENIKDYTTWFTTELSEEIRNNADNRYLVDQIMYALGKRIKNELPRQVIIY